VAPESHWRGDLRIIAGATARSVLAKDGWDPAIFQTMIGASGGPKFLGIAGLDQFLFADYLQRSSQPLNLIGSSIGSWRHAALAQADPLAALKQLQHDYIHQYYAPGVKPTTAEVSEVSLNILDNFLGRPASASMVQHPRFRSHVVTARGRGPTGSDSPALQALGLAQAALLNTVSRSALQVFFQRVVFCSHPDESAKSGFDFTDFATHYAPLHQANTRAVLHASGSIPFVLTGERDIDAAPAGQYWDGGIVDYHFDLNAYQGSGLALYPHFCASVTPGWFDKFLPWRRRGTEVMDRVVLLCPSDTYLARLPHSKIPDRSDMTTLPHQERVEYWERAVASSVTLAEDFAVATAATDPLAHVEHF
jgi:hypothetical protein